MSIVSLLLAVGGAVLAATLFILFIAIIMAFTQINIPEKCKNCPLLFNTDISSLPICTECHLRHKSSTTHENL